MLTHLTTTLASLLPAVENPLDGVTPSMSIFGDILEGKINLIVGAIWGALIVAAGVLLLLALFGLHSAKDEANPSKINRARGKLFGAAIALLCVLMAPVIIGVFVKLAE